MAVAQAKTHARSTLRTMAPLPWRSFAVLVAASVILWWSTLRATLVLALGRDEYTHILLILPLSITLIAMEWKSQKLRPSANPGIGGALAISGLLLNLLGSRLEIAGRIAPVTHLTIAMAGLVLFWIGSFIGCFGLRAARRVAFPLCLLVAAIPAPEWTVGYIVSFLQNGSAWTARMLFSLVGVPVAQDGVTLSMPGLTIEVAKECSSIRSSMMLVVTSAVFAHLMLRTESAKILVVLLAAPLSILKNAIRIFALSMLSMYVNPGVMHSWLHHQGGIVFFAISLVALYFLIRLAGWVEGWKLPKAAATTSIHSTI